MYGPDAASVWISRLGQASVWGGLVILAVAAACRLLPRLPASVRAGFWWLACLKIVFDLYGAAPISLPLLPAPPVQSLTAPALLMTLSPSSAPSAIAPLAKQSTQKTLDATQAPVLSAVPRLPSWPLCLSLCWLAGVLCSLAVTLRQGLNLRRILQSAVPFAGDIHDAESIAATLSLRRAPHLLQHAQIAAPCVAGWRHPAILLPPDLADRLTHTELHLALAHEMAHLRRWDLQAAVLPTLARILFFFHPLVWWAGAEWAAAREEACDTLALQATGASPVDYGKLLLKMASGEPTAPALGLSPGFHGLRRRLIGLPQYACESRRSWTRFLLAAALPLLLPWRLTAAIRPMPPAHSAASSPSTRYQITDLGEIVGGEIALNAAGQIAGTASGPNDSTQGLLWNAGQTQALGALPKHHASIAYGLNNLGQVAAASYNIPGRGRAFLWDGTRRRLGSLPGFPYSEARGVNDSGQVAGFAETGGHDRWRAQIARAFLWDSGKMTDLGTLGGAYSYAYGLNNSGVVVGKADTAVFGQTHAFAWTENGEMSDLGTLGGANSLAYQVSDQGQTVGYSETGDGETRHAFLWADGQMRDLGTLPGWANSTAYAINNSGDAVGAAAPTPDAPSARALLWHNGQVLDLNRLLQPNSSWTLEEARAINDKGQIAGRGRFHGLPRAFLLTPRP